MEHNLLEQSVYDACQELKEQQSLITKTSVQQKLANNLNISEQHLCKLINKWRLETLSDDCNQDSIDFILKQQKRYIKYLESKVDEYRSMHQANIAYIKTMLQNLKPKTII